MKCSVVILILAQVIYTSWSISLVDLLHQLPVESEPFYCIVQSGTERHLVQEVFEDISKNGQQQTVVTSNEFKIAEEKISHVLVTFDNNSWESIELIFNDLFFRHGWNNMAYFVFVCESEFDFKTVQNYAFVMNTFGITKSVLIFSDNQSFGYDHFANRVWHLIDARSMIYHLQKDYLKNVHGYALRISVYEFHLSISITNNPLKVGGPTALFLEAFADHMNATIEWLVDYYTNSEVEYQVLYNRIDIITHRPFWTPLLVSIYENNYAGMVLLIPEKLRASFFNQLLIPFSDTVWIFVLVLFVCCMTLNKLMKEIFPRNILLLVFFGGATAEHNLLKIERLTFLVLSIVVFLLSEAYLAKMFSYILSEEYDSHLKTLEEFERTTIPLCHSFNRSDLYRKDIQDLAPQLLNRLVERDDSKKWYIDIESCSWIFTLKMAEAFVEYKINHDPITWRKKFYMLPQILGWKPTIHSVSRKGPFVATLAMTYQWINEAGLFQLWKEQDNQKYIQRKWNSLVVLGLDDLLSLWYILGYGFALSGAIFLTEVCIKAIKNFRKRRGGGKKIKKPTIIQVKPKSSDKKC